MKSVFITGITGMVGSHLTDFLLENTDWEIFGFARWNDSLDNIVHLSKKINKKDRVHLLYGDLNDLASLIKALKISKPDYVFILLLKVIPKLVLMPLLRRLKQMCWEQQRS